VAAEEREMRTVAVLVPPLPSVMVRSPTEREGRLAGLVMVTVEEEGLPSRWARHERHHFALAAGLEAMGLSLLPPPAERLWTLNAVRVPPGVDEAAVRKTLLTTFNLEIGAGLGPLAGRIWRVGLMGASSTPQTLLQFLAALEGALEANGHTTRSGAGAAAAAAALRQVPVSA